MLKFLQCRRGCGEDIDSRQMLLVKEIDETMCFGSKIEILRLEKLIVK